MWAQLIKGRVKSGKESGIHRVHDQLQAAEQPGSPMIRVSVLRDQADPSSVYSVVIFESEEKARERERDPRREEALKGVRETMADTYDGPPEFVNCDVVLEVTGPSETETNKRVFRQLMEDVFNDGNLDLIDEIIAPDWVNIDPSLPVELRGREGARELVTMWRTGFPGFTIAIEDMVAESDKIAARFSFTGVHTGEFLGVPATGKEIHGTGTGIFRFVDGKDVQHNVNFDALGVLQQLGVIPVPEAAAL